MRPVVPTVVMLAVLLAAGVFDGPKAVQARQATPPAQTPPAPSAQTPPPAPPSTGQPSFRTGIDVVSLNVTVADGSGRFVTNLDRDMFSVYEDGIKQQLTFFNRSNLPIALSVLLDTSASMEDKIQTAQDAAIGFVKKLRPQDFGQIIDFDSRVIIAQPFTNSVPDLEQAIRKTTAGGSTSLHNAIYISLKELKKIQARSADDVRRQAIVVLSDGEDTSSLVGFDEVLELAKRSETAIYAIGLRGRSPDHVRGAFNEADFVLRQLSQETGGRVFFARTATELTGIYENISDELSSQYMLGYQSRNPKRDGAWRRVVVRVSEPGATARTKQGYYAPAS
jgi:Ca-activated chloride channel family protein